MGRALILGGTAVLAHNNWTIGTGVCGVPVNGTASVNQHSIGDQGL